MGDQLLHAHVRITMDFTVDIVDTLDQKDPQKRLLQNLIAHGNNEQHTLSEYLLSRVLWDHFVDKSDWYWLETFLNTSVDEVDDVDGKILAPILALDPTSVIRWASEKDEGMLYTEDMDECIKTKLCTVHVQDTLHNAAEQV